MNELGLDAARSGVFKTTPRSLDDRPRDHALQRRLRATGRFGGLARDRPRPGAQPDAVADAIGLLLQSMSGTPQDSAGELLNAECARAALELTSVLTRIMGEALEIYSLATEALADRVAFGYGAISTPSASAARPSCASPVAASRCTSSMANAPEAMSRLSSRPRR